MFISHVSSQPEPLNSQTLVPPPLSYRYLSSSPDPLIFTSHLNQISSPLIYHLTLLLMQPLAVRLHSLSPFIFSLSDLFISTNTSTKSHATTLSMICHVIAISATSSFLSHRRLCNIIASI